MDIWGLTNVSLSTYTYNMNNSLDTEFFVKKICTKQNISQFVSALCCTNYVTETLHPKLVYTSGEMIYHKKLC